MKLKKISLYILFLMIPLTGHTEDLLSVYRTAKSNDPTLQAAKAGQLSAAEASPQALANFLPTIRATAANTANHNSSIYANTKDNGTTSSSTTTGTTSQSYNQSTYGLALTQPIFYYQQWVQYAQATEQVKQANATYAAAEQDLIVRTVQAYFGVLKAYDALKFARAQRVALGKFLDQTEQRFKVGLIAITDVQIAKAQRDSAYAQEISAENTLANAKEVLRQITDKPMDKFYFLRDELTLKSPEPNNIEKWVVTALDQNFTLQASRFGVAVSRQNIKINEGGHFPTISVNGNITSSTSTPSTPTNTNSSIGLQVALPLFSGGAVNSKTRQAVYNYEQIQKQMETLYRQVESNTRQAYRGVLTQISQIQALKQAIISNASALKATDAAFRVGTRTIVDVLNSQTSLIQAEQNYANARYDYILQSIQLKQAAGTLSPEDVQHINSWLTVMLDTSKIPEDPNKNIKLGQYANSDLSTHSPLENKPVTLPTEQVIPSVSPKTGVPSGNTEILLDKKPTKQKSVAPHKVKTQKAKKSKKEKHHAHPKHHQQHKKSKVQAH